MYTKYCLVIAILAILFPCILVFSNNLISIIFGLIYTICLIVFCTSKYGKECINNIKNKLDEDE
jgi:hypothetical protein